MAKLRVTRDSFLHIRITSGLKQRIREAAKKAGVSQSTFVVMAIMDKLKGDK